MTNIAANSPRQVSSKLTSSRHGSIARKMRVSFFRRQGLDVDAIAPQVDGKFMSAFVRAVKPASAGAKACCGPTCCN